MSHHWSIDADDLAAILPYAITQFRLFARSEVFVKQAMFNENRGSPHRIASAVAVLSGRNVPIQSTYLHVDTLLGVHFDALPEHARHLRSQLQGRQGRVQPPGLNDAVP